MARITRKLQKIFALNSSDNGQFGSARAGTKIQTNDVETLQALTAYGDGWNAATVSGAKLPTLEEMQGLQYGLSYQIAYLMQEGIAEYNAATAYYIDSIVKEPGTVKLYASITNNNVGNALSNMTHWRLLVDLESVQPLNNFTATVNPTVNDDSGDGYSAGSTWYNNVGQDLFLCVDATVGAAVWVDTGVDLSDLGSLAFLNTVGAANVDASVATTAGVQTLTNKTIDKPVIIGITDGSAAAAGNVGQLISSTVASGSAIALTTGTQANITSISLTAGVWDIYGSISYNPAATTSITLLSGGINTTSAVLPSPPNLSLNVRNTPAVVTGANAQTIPLGVTRVNITSTTTYYLITQQLFTVSTLAGFGVIEARRVR